ncbi:hypothetical protein FPQ18DRAFT_301226 [Pyronema domesticum]|nr:hypothetical protein FPQ18DRAFT_301226 [Pyronema domesticum]
MWLSPSMQSLNNPASYIATVRGCRPHLISNYQTSAPSQKSSTAPSHDSSPIPILPLKTDEYQQTIVELQRFAQTFQFSLVISNCALLSETSSIVVAKLDENHAQIQGIIAGLEKFSVSPPEDLVKQRAEITEIKTLVAEIAESNARELNNIAVGVNDVQEKLKDTEIKGILPWISSLEPEKRHRDTRQKRLTGTGGAGKSVICSLVIDDLFTKSSIEAGTCVTYLYCVYQDEAKQTPENMMGTLLKQAISILHESNALPDKTIRFLQEKKAIPGDLSLKFRKFYVCIDALDECKAEHRGELLQSLAGVLEKCGQECSASLFATGRLHVNRVENVQRHRGLGSLVHIYLEASRDGIRKYITHAIDMDDNNDSVSDQTTISKRRKALLTMPVGLESAFEITINRIRSQNSQRAEQAMNVLMWTFQGERNLTISELQHALSVTITEDDTPEMEEELDWDSFPTEKSLVDWCLGLVIIDEETSTVRLVHKSFHDYLTRRHKQGSLFPNCHGTMAHICLKYMYFLDDNQLDPSNAESTAGILKSRWEKYCFLDYAVDNWGHHARQQTTPKVLLLGTGLFLGTTKLNRISVYLHALGHVEPLSVLRSSHYLCERIAHCIKGNPELYSCLGLSHAAYFGLDQFFLIMIERLPHYLNRTDSPRDITPLRMAYLEGHEGILRILLNQKNINLRIRDERGDTVFHMAARYGRVSLWEGVDVNFRDEYGWTPLMGVARRGHKAIVRLLLEREDIDINLGDKYGCTPLMRAASIVHEAIVRLLLDREDIDVKEDGPNVLRGVLKGEGEDTEAIVKLLRTKLESEGVRENLILLSELIPESDMSE